MTIAVTAGLVLMLGQPYALAAGKPGAADASPTAGTPAPGKAYGSLADLLGVEPPAPSTKTLETIAKEFGNTKDSGAQAHIASKKLVVISARRALLAALKKNLSIKISGEDAKRLALAIKEAEAVFNPTFSLSANWHRSETFLRTTPGVVKLSTYAIVPPGGLDLTTGASPTFNTVADGRAQPGNGVLVIPTFTSKNPAAQIDIVGFVDLQRDIGTFNTIQRPGYCDRQVGFLCYKNVKASDVQPYGPTHTTTYTVQVDQQLPWGSSFSIGTVTTQQKIFYAHGGHSYNRDFATNLVLNANIALPGTRNFGRYSSNDVSILLSKKTAERADWDLKTVINDTISSTAVAYWQLVDSLENLAIVIDNRKLVGKLVARTDRLYKQGLTTAYGKAQMDAEYDRVKALEETAKVSVISSSNTLMSLIAQSGQDADPYLLIPRSYGPLMNKYLVIDPEGADALALKYRPDLQAEMVSKQASDISLAYARQQVKPDVTTTANVQTSQDGSVIGYRDYWDAMGNVLNPDTLSQSYSADYQYPWKNRALKARLTQAEKSNADQALVIRNLKNTIAQQVNDALAAVLGARARITAAEKNLAFAQKAYDKLVKRRNSGGEVKELELITKEQDLVNARSTRLSALIDNKIAESQLLSAEGIIASQYGEATALNNFEKQRLKLLSKVEPMRYFKQLVNRGKELTGHKVADE